MKNQINSRKILEDFSDILNKFIFERISEENINTIRNLAAKSMYENGFNDDWNNDFRPVIPNVNLKIDYDNTNGETSLYFYPYDNTSWMGVTLSPV